jgi:hypothetical protein
LSSLHELLPFIGGKHAMPTDRRRMPACVTRSVGSDLEAATRFLQNLTGELVSLASLVSSGLAAYRLSGAGQSPETFS